MSAPASIQTQLLNQLTLLSFPHPSTTFLSPILSPPSTSTSLSTARTPPLNSLVATTKHRLLSSDLTSPSLLAPTVATLPAQAFDLKSSEYVLQTDIPVQVVDIEDLSTSKWDIVQDLEAERKGERTKGREIIRVVAEDPTQATQASNLNPRADEGRKLGPFKLTLQDRNGQTIYGFELKKVEKIGYPPMLGIGAKIMLKKGCKVARGMVLLQPESVVVLGGRIDRLERGWREGREERLREAVKRARDEREGG